MRLTIFCHVHYTDVWEEIAARLDGVIDQPFRLVVTTSLEPSAIKKPTSVNLLAMRLIQTENRGRDIRPFLQALRDEPSFDVGLKLHTKRSAHRLDGDGWRHAIITSLLPNVTSVHALFTLLGSSKSIGLVAPAGTLCSIAPWIGRNRSSIARVSHRLGIDPRKLFVQCPYFIAGSMFWFRAAAVRKFVSIDLDDLFAPERGQTDGTAAHAIERLFAPVAEAEGWLTLSMKGFDGTDIIESDLQRQRKIALADVDSDPRFLRRPHPYVAWISNHVPILVTLYRSMPTPLRLRLRNTLLSLARPFRARAEADHK